MEWVCRPSIPRLPRLMFERQVHRHAKRCCVYPHMLPSYADRQFGKAVARSELAPEGGTNGLELVRYRIISQGLAPFHRKASFVLAAFECRAIDPPVLFNFRGWHMKQDMMVVRDCVTLRHAAAP